MINKEIADLMLDRICKRADSYTGLQDFMINNAGGDSTGLRPQQAEAWCWCQDNDSFATFAQAPKGSAQQLNLRHRSPHDSVGYFTGDIRILPR